MYIYKCLCVYNIFNTKWLVSALNEYGILSLALLYQGHLFIIPRQLFICLKVGLLSLSPQRYVFRFEKGKYTCINAN